MRSSLILSFLLDGLQRKGWHEFDGMPPRVASLNSRGIFFAKGHEAALDETNQASNQLPGSFASESDTRGDSLQAAAGRSVAGHG